MKRISIFILGILFGIAVSIFGYSYLHGKEYLILQEDYKLDNGGILKKGTKIKYNRSFSEGFEQYCLYLNTPIQTDKNIMKVEDRFMIIPYWIKPYEEAENKQIR